MFSHLNIKKICFADLGSSDNTVELVKIAFKDLFEFMGVFIDEKSALISVLGRVNTENIIIVEPELYTRFHQIRFQIKKLRKSELIIPSRLDKNSKVFWSDKNKELNVKSNNLLIRTISGLPYDDTFNPNKAFKKSKIFPLLKKCKNKKYYWQEIIRLGLESDLKITSCETHYKEPKTVNEVKIVDDFIELVRCRKK
jgi:hypothetical protein